MGAATRLHGRAARAWEHAGPHSHGGRVARLPHAPECAHVDAVTATTNQ